MFIWALTQSWGSKPGSATAQLGGLGRTVYTIALTLLVGAVVGGLHWGLGMARLRASLPLRIIAATMTVAACLTALTLATGLSALAGPWARVARSEFGLSTALLSLVFGWLIARDPLGLARSRERVYLTPKDVAALPESERARLTLEPDQPTDGGTRASAG
jgi:hypothetical protein